LIQPSELKFRLLMQKIQIKKIYRMNTFSAENTTRTRAKIYYRRSRINSEFAVSLAISKFDQRRTKYSSFLTKNRDSAIKKRYLSIPIHVFWFGLGSIVIANLWLGYYTHRDNERKRDIFND